MKTQMLIVMISSAILMPAVAWAEPNADLRQGIYKGNSALVEKALLNGAHTNQSVRYGNIRISALSWAARWGNLKLVKLLLSRGANPNFQDGSGLPALKWAVAFGGNLEIVKALVEKGADLNPKDKEGYTILMSAGLGGHLPIIKYLVERGTNIHARNKTGYTALMAAANEGHLDAIKYLIEKGANLAAKDDLGRTVLTEAIWGNHLDVVSFYLDHVDEPQEKEMAVAYATIHYKTEVLKLLKEREKNSAQHREKAKNVQHWRLKPIGSVKPEQLKLMANALEMRFKTLRNIPEYNISVLADSLEINLPAKIELPSNWAQLLTEPGQISFKTKVAGTEKWQDTGLTNKEIQSVNADQKDGRWMINMELTPNGTKLIADITQKYLSENMGIFLDGKLLSAPMIHTIITGGKLVIEGNFSKKEAADLAQSMSLSPLPMALEIESEK